MNRSPIFSTQKYKVVETELVRFLNSQPDYLSSRSASSPRAVGDAMQELISENFKPILGDISGEYSAQFARRAMADLAFFDHDRNYYVVDVKTHRLDTHFKMPNLISVKRLTRFYEDDKNYFVSLIVKYNIKGTKVKVEKVHFLPIEFLAWTCLTIGALGWGQIQIANANTIDINEKNSRKKWVIQLCDVMLEFYPKEIGKISSRINYFKQIKKQWRLKS